MRKFSLLWLATTLSACSYHVDKAPDPTVGTTLGQLAFHSLNSQVLQPKCGQCHGGTWLGNYAATKALGPEIAARIQSTDPGFMMPKPGSTQLTAAERAAILDWINRGMPEDASAPSTPPEDPNALTFSNVQARVLAVKCLTCHRHHADFDTYEHTFKLLGEIDWRIDSDDEMDQMPPPKAPQLTVEEKNLLHRWIKAGGPEK